MAMEYLGNVISGVITGIAKSKDQLTPEQQELLVQEKVKLLEEDDVHIGSPQLTLLFGDFEGHGFYPTHMFVDCNKNVAVFPKSIPSN